MDKDSKGQRKLEDWRRATSCSGRIPPAIEQNRTDENRTEREKKKREDNRVEQNRREKTRTV